MKHNLKDIIDVNVLQSVLDNFSKATGMATVAVTSDGVNLTNPSCFTEFCIDRTRGTKEGLKRCMECDVRGGAESARTGRPAVYFCHAGLMDFGAPIIIDGKLVGSVLGGQVLPKQPDISQFVNIAHEIGADPNEYLNALNKISIVPEERIRSAAELLYIIVNEMASRWTQICRIEKSVDTIRTGMNEISDCLKKFFIEFQNIIVSQTELSDEIEKVSTDLSQINGVVKSVSKIADNTKMLGVNASIEAARAGTFGSGFSVVAREISYLSDKSKDTINAIQDFTENIEYSIQVTTQMSAKSRETLTLDIESVKTIETQLKNLESSFQDLYQSVNRM